MFVQPVYCIFLSFLLYLEKELWYYKKEIWYYFIVINDTILLLIV